MRHKIVICMTILFLIFSSKSFATSEILNDNINNIDFSAVQEKIDDISSNSDNKFLEGIDFKQYVKQIITGEKKFDLKEIVDGTYQNIVLEIKNNIAGILNILIVIIVSSILKNVTDSFKNKEVGKIAMYIANIIIVIAIFNSFKTLINIAYSTINSIAGITFVIIPIFIVALASTGNVTTATLSNSAMYAGIQFISQIVKKIFLPLILVVTILQIANYISEKEILSELNDFLKKFINWSLKGIFTIFFSLAAIQRFTAPVIDGIAKKGVGFATKTFVPVLGDMMTSAVDTIINCSVLIKNGIGVVAIIIVLGIIVIPILKILSFAIMYKLIAVVVQPIANKKIIKCFSEISVNCSMILMCLVITSLMFITSISMIMTIMS